MVSVHAGHQPLLRTRVPRPPHHGFDASLRTARRQAMSWKAASGLTEDKPLTPWKAPAHAPAPTQQPPSPHKEGPPPSSEGTSSVFACTLLVAGTAVGAGMLALPTVTSPAGFGASAVALCAGCAYSIVTGLLVAEVTINTLQQQRADGDLESASERAGGSASTSRVSISSTSSASSSADAANSHANPVVFARGSSGSSGSTSSSSSSSSSAASVSLTSIAQPLLGSKALPLVILPYFFLHYSLLVAYIAKAGELVGSWLHLPLFEGVALFTAVFGGGCYFLSAKRLDQINGSLVVVLIASFLGLLGIAARDLDPSRLGFAHWSALPPALPVIALAFVFQNIVPVVVQRLDCDPKKIQTSIFAGMGISLLMFLLWDGAILGSASSVAALDPLASLRAVTVYAGPLIEVFSFVAVATSFVGFVLSLTDFIGDTAASSRKQQRLAAALAGAAPGSGTRSDDTVVLGRPLLYFLALAPPMVLALLYPTIFFSALDYAGSYGVMSLFGLLPAVLAWQQRYVAGGSGGRGDGAVGAGGLVVDEKAEPLLPRSGSGSGSELVMVPGGRAALLLVSGVALAIIANQAVIHVGELAVALS